MPLDSQARETLNDPYFYKGLWKMKKRFWLLSCLDGIANDFVQKEKNLINYFNRYLKKKIPGNFTLKWKDYDWSLNDVSQKSKRIVYCDSSSLIRRGEF